MPRRLAARKFQPEVICETLEKSARPQLLAARQEVSPEMSADYSGREINQEVRGEQPRSSPAHADGFVPSTLANLKKLYPEIYREQAVLVGGMPRPQAGGCWRAARARGQ